MNDQLTRAEIDAKLETIEARMDGRVARIEDAVTTIAEDNAATRKGITELRKTVVVTAVGAALTVLFGIAAFNSALLSNMTASFESGRNTAQLVAESRHETATTLSEIRQIVSELKQQTVPHAQ